MLLRMLRLLGVLRPGNVLPSLAELLVVVRGTAMAFRAINVVSVRLTLILYVSGIAFRVLLEDTTSGQKRFHSVTNAMGTLRLEATLSGSRGGVVMREAYDESNVFGSLVLV